MDNAGLALIELGRLLERRGYAFTTVTPATHARINARSTCGARTLRDVFGWSRSFAEADLPREILDLLYASDQVRAEGGRFHARVRYSSLQGRLFVHSAFPTLEPDSVFFGPDTYRFCALLQRAAPSRIRRLVDIGCGTGAGAITLAERADHILLTDISQRALAFARVNAALAGVAAETLESDVLRSVPGAPDLIIANPPYMRDTAARMYRDGGGEYGEGLAIRILEESLPRLASGGTLILYTGAAITNGRDTFLDRAVPILREHSASWAYEEIDPDVFGEELESALYSTVDRIAAVALIASARS